MRQWTLSASAPALAIAILLAMAAPAAAITDVVEETWNALPGPGEAAEDARAAAESCSAAPGAACADAVAGHTGRDARDATSPALAWVQDFREDPVGVLARELAHMAEESARIVDATLAWLGSTLDGLGIGNPFGGDP